MADDHLLLSTRKGLFVYARARGGWRFEHHAHAGIPVSFALADRRDGSVWCALDHGHWGQKLTRSRDLGRTWEELAPPRYPEGAEVKPGVPASLRYVWCIAPGPASEPDVLYLGTDPGGLFRTRDGGRSFELVRGLWDHPSRPSNWFGGGRDQPGIHSILVDPRDPARVLVGISCAGVFETRDGGASWAPRNRGLNATFLPDPQTEVGHDPHLLHWSPADPDRIWQQNHCGIFRSRDGAASWTACSQEGALAHFGFPIRVDERDPETAWVLPAQSDQVRTTVGGALAVCRTRDGGVTWEELRAGLPQRECYDVVYRHALDLSGADLAFGSTTGNVYASADRGDSWSAVAHHLPPVYAVAFAA